MGEQSPVSADPTTRTSVVLFFIMLGVIIGFIALFLIIKPV
jgi:hypothetical protein